MKKKFEKITIYRILSFVLIFALVIGLSLTFFNRRQQGKTYKHAVETLTNILDDDSEKYITLGISTEDANHQYKLQFYGDGTNYYAYSSELMSNTFAIESYCEDDVEYVNSDFTNGFEQLATNNCSDRSYSISFGFEGYDFSSVSRSDIDVETEGDMTTMNFNTDKINEEIFIGDFAQGHEIKFDKFVIVSKKNSVETTAVFYHPVFGEMEIVLNTTNNVSLEKPEIK